MKDFKGRIVHPQNSPESIDYGKTVVVIGSGSTAAALIPAIAAESGHVTMLQRSPIASGPVAMRSGSPTNRASSTSTRR